MRITLTVTLAVALAVALFAAGPAVAQHGVDTPAPDGFRANRTSYSAIMDVIRATDAQSTVSDADLERLRGMQLEDIWRSLGDYRANYVRGFRSTQPGKRIAGRALTRCASCRRAPTSSPRLTRSPPKATGIVATTPRAAEEARPGDIVVAELGGADGHVLFGGMGALGIKLRGAAGVVIDGGSRDLAELVGEQFADFPVFARFFRRHHTTSWLGVEWNAPVRIGTTTVLPGDVVVADETGILFFPTRPGAGSSARGGGTGGPGAARTRPAAFRRAPFPRRLSPVARTPAASMNATADRAPPGGHMGARCRRYVRLVRGVRGHGSNDHLLGVGVPEVVDAEATGAIPRVPAVLDVPLDLDVAAVPLHRAEGEVGLAHTARCRSPRGPGRGDCRRRCDGVPGSRWQARRGSVPPARHRGTRGP